MTTYADVRTKFIERLRRRDCTNSLADGFISDAIKRVQRKLRVPAGERAVSVEIDDDSYSAYGLAIPSDLLKLRDITLTRADGVKVVLKRKPLSIVEREVAYGTEGTTWCFCRRGAYFVLGPDPLGGETVRVDYWSEFETADEDTDETILFDVAEDLIVFGALAYACEHFVDKRGQAFEARFQEIMFDLQMQGDDDELSGGAAVEMGFKYADDGLN